MRRPAFARVADLVDVSGDVSAFLSDHARAFARVYLEHANAVTRIALIHAVTGPSAVRLLLPHVEARAVRPLLRYTWQAAAAIYAASAGQETGPAGESRPPGLEELVERAVETRDEHALAPDDNLLAAALDATRHLRGA